MIIVVSPIIPDPLPRSPPVDADVLLPIGPLTFRVLVLAIGPFSPFNPLSVPIAQCVSRLVCHHIFLKFGQIRRIFPADPANLGTLRPDDDVLEAAVAANVLGEATDREPTDRSHPPTISPLPPTAHLSPRSSTYRIASGA